MAFCGSCGTKMEDNVKFCPSCGTPAAAAAPAAAPAAPPAPEPAPKANPLTSTPETTGEFDPADIQQHKGICVLAYLGPLVFIPMFAVKGSKFARYHASQGLTLFIAEAAYSITIAILSAILVAISWRLAFVGTILSLASLVFVVLAVLGIINTCNGRAKELPVIGKFKLLK